jgi:hypothetical protein
VAKQNERPTGTTTNNSRGGKLSREAVARRFFHEWRNTLPSRRIVFSWIACCVVLGSLAAGVSYAQTAQSPSKPKAQTGKLVAECNGKTKALADLAHQLDYKAANNAVEKIYQSAGPVLVEMIEKLRTGNGAPHAGTAQTDAKKAATVDEQLDALPDKTLVTALDFFNIQIDQVDACLSAAFGNRQINVAERLADKLDTAWSRESDLRSALNAHYQKAYDDQAVESPETLQQDLQGCQGWKKDLNEVVSDMGTTVEQASDEKSWDGLDNEQHRKLMKFYSTEKSIGFWCGAVVVESGVGGRADARAYLAHASKYAALGTDHIIRMYNDLLKNYNKALQWNHNALKALDDDQKLLAEDEKVIQLADRLLSRPPQPPLVFVQPAYAPPLPPPPQELHCVTQLNGSFAYTNCY